LSRASKPTAQGATCSESSGCVVVASGASGVLRTTPVPILSPDILAYESHGGTLLVAGNSNRILVAIPAVVSNDSWALPVVLDKAFGHIKGIAIDEKSGGPAPGLNLLLAVPQEARDQQTAIIFSATAKECDLQIHSFEVEWPAHTKATGSDPVAVSQDASLGGLALPQDASLSSVGADSDELIRPHNQGGSLYSEVSSLGSASRNAETIGRLFSVGSSISELSGSVSKMASQLGSDASDGRSPGVQSAPVSEGSIQERTERRILGLEDSVQRIETKLDRLMIHLGCR